MYYKPSNKSRKHKTCLIVPLLPNLQSIQVSFDNPSPSTLLTQDHEVDITEVFNYSTFICLLQMLSKFFSFILAKLNNKWECSTHFSSSFGFLFCAMPTYFPIMRLQRPSLLWILRRWGSKEYYFCHHGIASGVASWNFTPFLSLGFLFLSYSWIDKQFACLRHFLIILVVFSRGLV